MVRGTTGCFRHHARKSQCRQIQLVNEGVDNSDRTVFIHVVFKTVRKQCYLTTVTLFERPGHRNLQDFAPDSIKQLILIIIVLFLLFGGSFGYSRYGYRGGIGIGGVLLIILILYLLLGHGRIWDLNLKFSF